MISKELGAIPRDVVVEKVLPLTEDPKKKSKKPVTGQLKIRMYYSTLPVRDCTADVSHNCRINIRTPGS